MFLEAHTGVGFDASVRSSNKHRGFFAIISSGDLSLCEDEEGGGENFLRGSFDDLNSCREMKIKV